MVDNDKELKAIYKNTKINKRQQKITKIQKFQNANKKTIYEQTGLQEVDSKQLNAI